MAKTDLKGRYYERLRTLDTPPPPPFPQSNRFLFALFDSFDVAESELKIDHTIAIVARLLPFVLQKNGISEVFLFGQASHTGSHAFNLNLALEREGSLFVGLTSAGFPSTGINFARPDDSVDLHEGDPLGEHKRFRRVVLVCDATGIPDSDIDNLFPDPPGLNDEAD
jgi:hypothetical protein